MCEHSGPRPQKRQPRVAKTDIRVREPLRTPSLMPLSRDAAATSVTVIVTWSGGHKEGPPAQPTWPQKHAWTYTVLSATPGIVTPRQARTTPEKAT